MSPSDFFALLLEKEVAEEKYFKMSMMNSVLLIELFVSGEVTLCPDLRLNQIVVTLLVLHVI